MTPVQTIGLPPVPAPDVQGVPDERARRAYRVELIRRARALYAAAPAPQDPRPGTAPDPADLAALAGVLGSTGSTGSTGLTAAGGLGDELVGSGFPGEHGDVFVLRSARGGLATLERAVAVLNGLDAGRVSLADRAELVAGRWTVELSGIRPDGATVVVRIDHAGDLATLTGGRVGDCELCQRHPATALIALDGPEPGQARLCRGCLDTAAALGLVQLTDQLTDQLPPAGGAR